MYRLLAVDLDGTLCRRDGSVDPVDAEAIASLRRRGVGVGIVTGRLASGTVGVVEALDLVGVHAVADGGVLLDWPSGAVRQQQGLEGPAAQRLRELMAEADGATFALTADAIVHDARGEPFLEYMCSWSPETRSVASVLDDGLWNGGPGPASVVAIAATGALRRAVAALRADTSLELLTFDSRVVPDISVLVARPPGVTKGRGVGLLATHHGCSPAEVVAVGDWLNDVDMFRVAGRSFAVPGGPAVVAEAATDRLETRGGRGAVAEAIRRAWS